MYCLSFFRRIEAFFSLSLTRNEYLIFQKIIKLEYDFPEKFFPKAKDLVEKLLVSLFWLFVEFFIFFLMDKNGTRCIYAFLIKAFLILLFQCSEPTKRLGCEEMGGYVPLRSHAFFESISWENLHLQSPPKLTPYLPAMAEDEEEYYGNVSVFHTEQLKSNRGHK